MFKCDSNLHNVFPAKANKPPTAIIIISQDFQLKDKESMKNLTIKIKTAFFKCNNRNRHRSLKGC